MRVRQCDRECAAFSYDRFQRDMAFEGLDDALADGQSQSCSLGEFVEFLETFKDHGLFLFGNAFTGIGHVNQDEVVIRG